MNGAIGLAIFAVVFSIMLRLFNRLSRKPKPPPAELELNEADHPSIALAYEFVVPTYNWAIQRFEAGENRLQSLQTFAMTIAFAIPVAAKAISTKPDFESFWFWAGICTFVIIVAGASLARWIWSTQTLVGMEGLYSQEYLGISEWQFKRAMVHHAASHQNKNLALISARAAAANILTALILFEVVFFVVWLRQGVE